MHDKECGDKETKVDSWRGDSNQSWGSNFFNQGIPKITLGLLSCSIISSIMSEWSSRVMVVLAFHQMVPF